MKKSDALILHIFVLLISILIYSINFDIKFREIYLLLIYIYTIFTAHLFLDVMNAYLVFLYTLGLFNFSRIILDLLNYERIGWATKFANYYFSIGVINELLYVFLLTLLFIHLGFYIAINTNKLDFNIELKRNELYLAFAKGIFIIFSFILAIKLFIQFKAILSYGYTCLLYTSPSPRD